MCAPHLESTQTIKENKQCFADYATGRRREEIVSSVFEKGHLPARLGSLASTIFKEFTSDEASPPFSGGGLTHNHFCRLHM